MANEYLVNNADLLAVANAIREKAESTDGLVFPNGFVDAIAAIKKKEFSIITTVESGAEVTATSGDKTVSGVSDGTCTLLIPDAGDWVMSATIDGAPSNTQTVEVRDEYAATLIFFVANLSVYTSEGATVTCVKDNYSFEATAGDNGTVNFTLREPGAWTVTASKDGKSLTETVTVTEEGDYTVYVALDLLTLNSNSWEKIREISDEGKAANYWAVGDTKQITINGTVGNTTFDNYSTWVYILGFDHNSSVEGTNRVHFQIGKTAQTGGTSICLIDSNYGSSSTSAGYFNMNYSMSNTGGWASSKMRTVLLGSGKETGNTLFNALPSDLTAQIKPCTKYSDNTGGGSDTASYVTTTEDYIWLLSEFEVQGQRSYANSAEQTYQQQYAYFANGNSKVKYRHSATSTSATWWLRSACATPSYDFCYVNTIGGANGSIAYYSRGVAPGFCI